MIRQRLFWNMSLPVPDDFNMVHMDHCVDGLRQSLMCSVDITPISYAWYPSRQETLPTTGVAHTCRDYDVVADWARQRQTVSFDTKIHVENPLGDVIYLED